MIVASTSLKRVYTCRKCSLIYIVAENDPNIHLLQKTMRCPNALTCAGRIKIYAATNMRVAGTVRVSALHLYQASMGAGMPDEKHCSPKEVRQMLLGATVLEADLESAPDPQRSLIKSLTLSSGKVIHLAASTKGATIYKVTEVR